MKKLSWQIILGLMLLLLAALLHYVHYLIFRDTHHIFIYLLGDFAFLPIEVLVVTLIVDRVLSVREKRTMLDKLNMVIGAFFSEVGLKLILHFSKFDLNSANVKKELWNVDAWNEKDFIKASKMVGKFKFSLNCTSGDLTGLKEFLSQRRSFLLRLLENPNLLEHESFTALLWAVFHLTEELEYRTDIGNLPESDYNHISGDMKRAYIILVGEWIAYVRHLKNNYPYLFSLVSRINPFNDNASPIVR